MHIIALPAYQTLNTQNADELLIAFCVALSLGLNKKALRQWKRKFFWQALKQQVKNFFSFKRSTYTIDLIKLGVIVAALVALLILLSASWPVIVLSALALGIFGIYYVAMHHFK